MPGTNQLPSGSEVAVAISLIWALSSWICSVLLLWVTWAHGEGGSYLALLGVSSFISNTFSIVQQGHDITWYAEIVTTQFEYKRTLPGNDPELAIAGGSYGLDLVLYYIQYYSYNVQAMLVMFWAAELCQLTWQVGERRKIRKVLRGLHTAGTFISFLFPLITILCLRIPALKRNFVAFILVADLPLMFSLAIGSGLMISVTVKYVQSRQKFTQWAPPKFASANSASDAGTSNTSGTQNSSHRTNGGSRSGGTALYDRWLLVRFSIAFVLLAVFEVTNTLFQVTALQNNLNDVVASAPDLSTGRAIQTFFLFMPGTTPGIFIYIVFGTTRSSRQKVAKLIPHWLKLPSGGLRSCFTRITKKHSLASSTETLPTHEERGDSAGGITVQRSLTVTSAARTARSSQLYVSGGSGSGAESSESSDIWLKELTPKRSHSTLSTSQSSAKKPLPPLPLSNKAATFNTTVPAGLPPPLPLARLLASPVPVSAFNNRMHLAEIEEKDDDESMSRTTTADSLRVPYHEDRCAEHSDDSGPILPIQRPEVRFSQDVIDAVRRASGRNRHSRNFSRPGL